ncbi:hypothetical protein C8F04DRAFT_1250803 [Mycena alexandri]|uniref:Uncharacterized protein n=1 Tax=Mycena alexandri TaxID=1745969 RepID=A0AAD6TFI2_9AGAR|nr:hypothetical protein C8F04DRAFT_1250803 [Mycena alexandri]
MVVDVVSFLLRMLIHPCTELQAASAAWLPSLPAVPETQAPPLFPNTTLPARAMPNQLEIHANIVDAIGLVNLYRTYIIFGDTVGGIERYWARQSYQSAAAVWSAVHLASVDVLEESWYHERPEHLLNCQRRLRALRGLACALEAQGDTSLMSSSHQSRLPQHFRVQKRRARGTISPEREIFLCQHLDEYCHAIDNGNASEFWPAFMTKYYHDFPWRLPIDVDPHCAMILDCEPLTPRDIDVRTVVKLNTKKKLRAWFNHKRVLRTRNTPARDFEIIRPASWWKDFHERKKRERERQEQRQRPSLDLAPGQQQSPLWTFVPGRSAPIVSVVQNDGTLRAEPVSGPVHRTAKPYSRPIMGGGSPHTPLADGPGPSKRALAIMARVNTPRDPDSVLLQRLHQKKKYASNNNGAGSDSRGERLKKGEPCPQGAGARGAKLK